MKRIARNLDRRSRGFAMIFAIAMIILVGAALILLGGYFAQQANRTRSQSADAQLRQLLIAGSIYATQNAQSPGPEKPLPLPKDLTAQDASVTVQITGEGDERTAVIAARFNQRHVEQSLKLHRDNDRWSVMAIESDATTQLSPATQPSDRSTAASQRS